MRDWRAEQWDNRDWNRAIELADDFWFDSRRGLYVYDAERALRQVEYERGLRRFVAEEEWWWGWYCRIYPDLRGEP